MDDLSAVQKLYYIVKDPDLCNVYEEYLVKHLAWENFGFWFEVENYKLEEDPEEQKKQAGLIYAKFLDIGCIFELGDLEPNMRDLLQKKINNPTKTMFNALQRKVMSCLALATIGDFFEDEMYKIFEKSRVDNPPKLEDPFEKKKLRDKMAVERMESASLIPVLKKEASVLSDDKGGAKGLKQTN